MKIKVFYPDRDGRISFTKKELEELLDEVYREGYNDNRPYTWTSPYYNNITTTPYITLTSMSSNSSNADNSTATISDFKYSSQSIQYVEK